MMFRQSRAIWGDATPPSRAALAFLAAAVLVFGLVTGGALLTPVRASADSNVGVDGVTFVASYYDDDGVLYELYIHGEETYEWILYPDGTVILVEWGNPNPEDPNGTDYGNGMEGLLALLKQRGGPAIPAVNFLGTPIGIALVEGGKTIVPIHNPAELADLIDELGGSTGGFGGFDPMGGSIQEQLKKASRSGDGEDPNGDGSDPLNGEGFWNGLPGPPELVNPALVERN